MTDSDYSYYMRGWGSAFDRQIQHVNNDRSLLLKVEMSNGSILVGRFKSIDGDSISIHGLMNPRFGQGRNDFNEYAVAKSAVVALSVVVPNRDGNFKGSLDDRYAPAFSGRSTPKTDSSDRRSDEDRHDDSDYRQDTRNPYVNATIWEYADYAERLLQDMKDCQCEKEGDQRYDLKSNICGTLVDPHDVMNMIKNARVQMRRDYGEYRDSPDRFRVRVKRSENEGNHRG